MLKLLKKLISIFSTKKKNYLKCPNCKNDTFHEGPGGGSFGNIKCLKCEKWYNNMGPFGLQEIRK